jgi:hypothetical protein
MLKENYKPRSGFALVELTVFRPKEEKAVFKSKDDADAVIKEGDIPAYKVLAKANDSDLKVGGYVLLAADLNSPGMYGNIIPEGTILSEVEYEGLDDYIIKSYAELVKEHEQAE